MKMVNAGEISTIFYVMPLFILFLFGVRVVKLFWPFCLIRFTIWFVCLCFFIYYIYQAPRLQNLLHISTQLSTEFILLINVKMPTIFSMMNTTSERLKAFVGVLVLMSS